MYLVEVDDVVGCRVGTGQGQGRAMRGVGAAAASVAGEEELSEVIVGLPRGHPLTVVNPRLVLGGHGVALERNPDICDAFAVSVDSGFEQLVTLAGVSGREVGPEELREVWGLAATE